MSIPEYLAEVRRRIGKDVVYYYDKSIQEFSAGVVSDATRIPVLSLWTLNDDAFVRRVCRRRRLELLPYTELAARIIKKPQDEETYQSLILACAARKIAADVREYFYSRRNLTSGCLARQVLVCDFRAISFRRTW